MQEVNTLELLSAASDDSLVQIKFVGTWEIDVLEILSRLPDIAHEVEGIQAVQVSKVMQQLGGRRFGHIGQSTQSLPGRIISVLLIGVKIRIRVTTNAIVSNKIALSFGAGSTELLPAQAAAVDQEQPRKLRCYSGRNVWEQHDEASQSS